MCAMRIPNVAVIVDSDGVAVEPGKQNVDPATKKLFFFTPTINVLATGRSLSWGWEPASQINARGVFAENGATYQFTKAVDGRVFGEEIQVLVNGTQLECLKEAIRFVPINAYEATIQVGTGVGRVLVEPGKSAILTLGTRSMHGRPINDCPWGAEELARGMVALIQEQGLPVRVVGPHEDGNIDFQPMMDGKAIDKSVIPSIIMSRLPYVERIIALIDGDNDISLANHPMVFPITFANGCVEVREIARSRGVVIEKVGYQGGCREALHFIQREFLGIAHSSR